MNTWKRNAVASNIHALKVVCDELRMMCDLTCWSDSEEAHYFDLIVRRNVALVRLKKLGMHL